MNVVVMPNGDKVVLGHNGLPILTVRATRR